MNLKILILLILIGSPLWLYAQGKYPVRGTVYIMDGIPVKTNLNITVKGEKSLKIPVDRHGDFYVFLDWNKDYTFQFSKVGYVSKNIEFCTVIPDKTVKRNLYPYELMIELFPTFPNVDSVFYKKPVAKIKYNETISDFEYDLDYQLSIVRFVENTKQNYRAWKKKSIKQRVQSVTKGMHLQKEDMQLYEKKQKEPKNEPVVSVKHISEPKDTPQQQNSYGLPPLKNTYPLGKTVEYFDYKSKKITRVVINKKSFICAYYEVKHNWGGVFYFSEKQPGRYANISKYSYRKSIGD